MSLQIPPPTSRPVSAAVAPSSQSRRQPPAQHRASHQVVTSSSSSPAHEPSSNSNGYTDVYSHPAATAYAAAHPRRTIPKFGPYLLLQTLGEGEFGKVKLGLHSQWGEEVAVKLIRRGNVDSAVRMSKVEREIEVLRTLKHPNIVRLYDVIETDKYIGIVIEYASGGELFDHILAHRYLRERDASKLFSQLISGVWYIHQKKIVHRDLKLENLLLDRHRNVIITDFGFANRFEHRADDLMQTSCGSPCYAAPELVISEGLYVGSAVDIWSCGVILYAMLAGYLPFDDDPANPDGDNINLLYKYIVNTPLSFPDYISDEARDLLKLMLVPDPRKRASLDAVMQHSWLAAYHVEPKFPGVPNAFGKTVDELESAAMDQHQMKRLAYQRQMRAAAAPAAAPAPQISRSQTLTQSQTHTQNQTQSHSQRNRRQPETLYDSASGGMFADDDDPFGPPPGTSRRPAETAQDEGEAGGESKVRAAEVESSRKEVESPRKGKEKERDERFRHTVQIEYGERRGQRTRAESSGGREIPIEFAPASPSKSPQGPSRSVTAPVMPPISPPALPVAPPVPASSPQTNGVDSSSISERKEKRRRGSTSSGGAPKPLPPDPNLPPTTWKNSSPKGSEAVVERPPVTEIFTNGDVAAEKEAEAETPSKSDAKKSRRNTLTGLTVIVNPINSIRSTMSKKKEPETATSTAPPASLAAAPAPAPPLSATADKSFDAEGSGMRASTSKARKVMDWIRKGRDSLSVGAPGPVTASPADSISDMGDSAGPVHITVTTPSSALSPIVSATVGAKKTAAPEAASASAVSPTTTVASSTSFRDRFRRSINVGGSAHETSSKASREAVLPAGAVMRVHHGAVDQGTITTGKPPQVMEHVKQVLQGMGIELAVETEFKLRCVRPKLRRSGKTTINPQGVAAFTMVGSAGSNGVDKRGLPMPSQSSFSSGGMLRGLLMRRQSSQVSTGPTASPTAFDPDESGIITSEPTSETVYGVTGEDAGDEVRFSVELTRIDRLNDTYSLDIRRMKGNLRSYKFLYDMLRKRADLQRALS
ncbi:unnamed protein product [Mycena citricolor]|uniref:Non-specific serine/threonine protein kinase n=1 Tax=Mycena citricolor TaxID=2018698 RepID=A0AAD2K016_9AGAR|nr:unnamed protein product [Mycena citricolor]